MKYNLLIFFEIIYIDQLFRSSLLRLDKLIGGLGVALVVITSMAVRGLFTVSAVVTAIRLDLDGVGLDERGDLLVSSGLVIVTIVSDINVSADGTTLQFIFIFTGNRISLISLDTK